MSAKSHASWLIVLAVAIAMPLETASGAATVPEIGTKLAKHLLKIASHQRQLCMTAPAQLDPCFEYDFDKVRYTVSFDARSKRVTYISTTDEAFRTADGLQI